MKLNKKDKVSIGCILIIAYCVLGGGYAAMALWVGPVMTSITSIVMADYYMRAEDIAYEKIAEEVIDINKIGAAEWKGVFYKYDEYWALIADSKAEFDNNYGIYGIQMDGIENFDFEKNILVISINRPLKAIRIMAGNQVCQKGEYYSYPQFAYGQTFEKNKLFYYSVPRITIGYLKNNNTVKSNPLKFYSVPYLEKDTMVDGVKPEPKIESIGPLKNWIWAFHMFNG